MCVFEERKREGRGRRRELYTKENNTLANEEENIKMITLLIIS